MDHFLKALRDNALNIKLTPSQKDGGAVRVEEFVKVMKSLSESYRAFLSAEYLLTAQIGDQKKLNIILKGLFEESDLLIVNMEYGSAIMSLSPNTQTYSKSLPKIPEPLKWKKDRFHDYQELVFGQDYKDKLVLDNIASRYSSLQRTEIFKPIVTAIFENSEIKTKVGVHGQPAKTITPPTKAITLEVLTPQIALVSEPQPKYEKAIAMVDFIPGKRINPGRVDLFTELKEVISQYRTIKFGNTLYSFRIPITGIISKEGDLHNISNESFGIFVHGNTYENAKLEFDQEIDYLYRFLMKMNRDKLDTELSRLKVFFETMVEVTHE